MSETPVDTSTEPTPAPEGAVPESPQSLMSEMAEAVKSQPLTVRTLLEAGVHFGHQTRRWNPQMKRFIFGERDGIHIVDLDQTLPRFQTALDFLKETVASGGKVLFVGTKRQAAAPIQTEAVRAGQFYVNNRWLGGMLTNFRTVKKSIERYKQMLEILGDEEKLSELTKKEGARLSRESTKYSRSLEGIKEMGRLPDALFVIDVACEHIAVSEAKRLGIPIVAVVDTNCAPQGIEYVIPGNDDAMRAIHLYCAQVADACLEGAALHNERIQAQEAQQAEQAAEQAAAPSTGRVVVEIKQPPRRGRGAEEREQRRRKGKDGAPAAEAAPAEAPPPAEPATDAPSE